MTDSLEKQIAKAIWNEYKKHDGFTEILHLDKWDDCPFQELFLMYARAILPLVRGRFEEIAKILLSYPQYRLMDMCKYPQEEVKKMLDLCAIDEPKPESEPTVDEYHDALLTLLRHTTTDIIDLAKKMDKERKP